ncbi:PadR family transcriptional regulator [Kitasatospora sp. HPMI-4]|uniref:PadR family transcriptional regulator n=1 Tax=Kitasatospora sp. HPMI-4 TaxID=3448443 RepID=UPI003F1934BD
MTSADLTPTAWTILGFLSLHPRNGYQLRQAAQRSVGHFWGVSYGQLYPQLKLLAEDGLIEPDPEPAAAGAAGPAGGRSSRSAAPWRLTQRGNEALRGWLRRPPEPRQLRDEGLVKLLFSDEAGPTAMLELIARRRADVLLRKELAEQIVPGAHWPKATDRRPQSLLAARLVLAHTLTLCEAELAWCDTAEQLVAEHRGPLADHPPELRHDA